MIRVQASKSLSTRVERNGQGLVQRGAKRPSRGVPQQTSTNQLISKYGIVEQYDPLSP
jgi:hypothetical protein